MSCSCSGSSTCLCGACAGTNVLTPQPQSNPPGLPAIARRIGTWAQFKESMLARLSSSDYPALQPLSTRQDDDFTIALLDATAVVLDILTFYQERLGNEFYLRTAQQPRSLTELSRLIGYRPAPGVSASAYLAFSLMQTPGQPENPNAPAITIPQGTQAQSVPPQGQSAQTFETAAAIAAKADWSSLQVQTGTTWTVPATGIPNSAGGFYLAGTATQLQRGDALLIVDASRAQWSASTGNQSPDTLWAVLVLSQVQPDPVRNRTYVAWNAPLTHVTSRQTNSGTGWTLPSVFALRQKATLFGHNAPNPYQFVSASNSQHTSLPHLIDAETIPWQWRQFVVGAQHSDDPSAYIDLDATYPKLTVGSWFVLVDVSGAQLYNVSAVSAVSRADYGLSAQVTQLSADFTDAAIRQNFSLRGTQVLAQSEALILAEQPLTCPLYGIQVSLETLRNDMASVKRIAVAGTRQKLAFTPPNHSAGTQMSFTPDDGTGNRPLVPGEIFILTSATNLPVCSDGSLPNWGTYTKALTLYAQDAGGRTGTLQQALLASLTLVLSANSDPIVSEAAQVTQINNPAGESSTVLTVTDALNYCYDRNTTTVNANVALASHGAAVTEIMGSGSAATPNQEFTLKQSPLTFVQSPTTTGSASTLEVQANAMDWTEVTSLYQQSPNAQVYATLNQADGTTEVIFGDGVEGATLPTGLNNIVANYRIGLGAAGNVAAGTITTLIDRPLGVNGVTNPSPATGGQDPQSLGGIRQYAPQSVLTLGRAVSIADYQSFASTYAGIAKAYAIWIPNGPGRGVFLTVAGAGGAGIPSGNPTNANLVTALQSYGRPLVPFTVQTYVETLFGFAAALQYDSSYDQNAVEAQVRATLASTFNFNSRSFGQGVSSDEIAALIQGVAGVTAVNVTSLCRGNSSTAGDIGLGGVPTVSQWSTWSGSPPTQPLIPPCPDTLNQLSACVPIASSNSLPQPAEILILDPRPSGAKLTSMS
jgi:predicted phage baseplate assembly protein